MLRLKLVRHGESEFNRRGIIQGHTNSPLSPLGRIQAELTGRWLKNSSPVSRIYASPLRRAKETALIMAEVMGVEVVFLDEFKEIRLGAWEGVSIEEVRKRDSKNLELWFTCPTKAHVEGAEPLDDFRKRVLGGLKRVLDDPDDEVAIVAHGGVLSVVVAHVLNLDLDHIWRMRFDNASVSEISFEYSIPKLTLLNSTFHLGALGRSGLSIWNV